MIIFTSTYIQFIRICSVWAAQDAFMYRRTSTTGTVLKSLTKPSKKSNKKGRLISLER